MWFIIPERATISTAQPKGTSEKKIRKDHKGERSLSLPGRNLCLCARIGKIFYDNEIFEAGWWLA